MGTSTDDYARQAVADTLRQLDVAAALGLSAQQVRDRLARFGYNEIEETEEPLWHRVFRCVSSVLGVSGVVASFLLFFLLTEHGFSEDMIRTMLFLKLIVAGHSTLYITRTGGWFWQRPYPAPLLLSATFGTEILGTLIAVYGVLVAPIGWEYALWMWAYALAWFAFNDVVKWGAYRMLRVRSSI
jgi:hypothetical protein